MLGDGNGTPGGPPWDGQPVTDSQSEGKFLLSTLPGKARVGIVAGVWSAV